MRLLAFVLAVLVGAALAAALSPDLRESLKWLGPVRQAQLWLYNIQYPPLTPRELGDGGPAIGIVLTDPAGLAAGPQGNVYVVDRGRPGSGRVIWKIGEDGQAHIVAGTGRRGRAPTDVPARASDLGSPEGPAADAMGRVYFADSYNHLVLRLETDGRLTRIAGIGRPGYGGDGGPATAAALDAPYDVSLDSIGNLYIAEYGNHRIRKVTADGLISTAAGTGVPGYSGDGGPAVAAQLNGPYGVFVDPQDRLVIADSQNHTIRRVGDDGIIETIVGTGSRGSGGDGGPAREALLDTPQALAMDNQGRLLVGDEHNNVVRMITRDGMISTLVGFGSSVVSGLGRPDVGVQLQDPEALLPRADGSLLIAEGDNRRVVRLTPDGAVVPFAGRGQVDVGKP